MFSIDGLVSGLDTTSVIEGLISLQDAQVSRLNVRKNDILTQQTAFQGIEARLLSLRSAMNRLNRSSNSSFDLRSATSSNESIVNVSANSNAIEGTYSIQVNSLAKAHQIGSQGFESQTSSITEGTISFRLGDRPATEITVDQSNNTVGGLVAAINQQSDDISAAIVRDQATGTDRILLTSSETGESNQITVTNNLGGDSGNAVRPDFSGPAIQEAANASIQLGSGPGAITAEYETNQVTDLIQNVTIDLVSADAGQAVSISVSRDTENVVGAIEGFVEQYNSLMSYIDEQTRYNADTNVASPLLGNRSVSSMRNQFAALVTGIVPELGDNLNRLSQIGITIGDTGQLSLDSSRLNDVLAGNVEGVDLKDVKRLFGLTGESNNSGIEFLIGSSQTAASADGYQVDILQAAEQATVTGEQVGSTITIDSSNNEFQISVSGRTSEVLTLTEGTYTQEELADQLQSVINASDELGVQDVSVSVQNGSFQIATESYGSSSTISGISGSAGRTLGFAGDGSEEGVGRDVAGSFIVDGVVETATGSGRLLIGDSDNANTADLQVRVTLDASQVSTDIEGELSVSRGITSQLDSLLSDTLDPVTGTFTTANEDYDLRIESLDDSIARVLAISESKREYLIEQFTALERVLSSLQTTSSFLTSQLGSLPSG